MRAGLANTETPEQTTNKSKHNIKSMGKTSELIFVSGLMVLLLVIAKNLLCLGSNTRTKRVMIGELNVFS